MMGRGWEGRGDRLGRRGRIDEKKKRIGVRKG